MLHLLIGEKEAAALKDTCFNYADEQGYNHAEHSQRVFQFQFERERNLPLQDIILKCLLGYTALSIFLGLEKQNINILNKPIKRCA